MQKNEITEIIQQNYKIFKKIKGISKLKHNNINSTNYFFKSKNKPFLLRKITDGSSEKKLETMCKILQFCHKNNAKVIESISNNNHRYISNKKFLVTKYYSGHFFPGSKNSLQNFAKDLAYLHKVLSKNKVAYNYNMNTSFYRILNSQELSKIKKNKNSNLQKKYVHQINLSIKKINDYIPIISEHLQYTKKLQSKKQLIHFDIHPLNVIFNKNEVAVILDFNGMRKGLVIDDIVFASFRFAVYDSNNLQKISERIKLFLDSYQRYSTIEKDLLENYYSFLIEKILSRISFILKKYYFQNSSLWFADLLKNLEFLILAEKISKIKKL